MVDSNKKHWTDLVKDDIFVRNLIILGLFLFIVIAVIILYFTGALEIQHFYTTLDIAIGIVIGSYLIKKLNRRKNGSQ